MLPVVEETLVLARAVQRGDLQESEVPPETASAPQGVTLRFGRRLDRLVTRGRLTEKQVFALLHEVRKERLGKDQTLDPSQQAAAHDVGTDRTLLPESAVDSAAAEQMRGAATTALEPLLAQTLDGVQSEYLGPPPTVRFPVENWDHYEFLELLGQGGMGAVYKARDKRLGRIVALKFIRGGDEQLTQRFIQEARAQSRLDHKGICRVLEVGEVGDKAYIAMQFIDGRSLDKAMSTMSLTEKVQVLRDVALAMHYAHEKGIIHRDRFAPSSKPSAGFQRTALVVAKRWKAAPPGGVPRAGKVLLS